MSSPLVLYILVSAEVLVKGIGAHELGQRNYAEAKRRYPAEGLRRWKLRVAQQLWTAVGSGGLDSLCEPLDDVFLEATSIAESDTDPDPLDGVTTRDVLELGLIVRTDFSDEPSWVAFCTRLQDSEKELVLGSDEDASNRPLQPADNLNVDEDGDSADGENEDAPPAIFHIINPSSPQERELLAGISNLTALRLFNDIDIRPSPTPPHGANRIDPPHRLVDYHGWQEFYRGKNVWIYDNKSNIDQCVRVVSQSGDMYGTATGDSWRARVSHICELQVNLSSGAIKIDFGGLDRWDFNERRRNMMEDEAE
ncbi:hypothetical protein J3R82DRAFT_10756 [Butyriboletus roseoflavus]|nr:hypothetical protein J3R82DRAFT_10756 [Butyriboletus roseoflavus]